MVRMCLYKEGNFWIRSVVWFCTYLRYKLYVAARNKNLHIHPKIAILLVCLPSKHDFVQHAMSNTDNALVETNDNANRLVRAKLYKHGWNSDLMALSKFVKEQVFYVVVHDFKNESDDPLDVNTGAICQNLFLKKFPTKVTNIHMKKATKEEMTVYLKDLWTTALNTKGRGNIRRELSSEKSAVYAALNEAFRSK
jgi:hypothetical protein